MSPCSHVLFSNTAQLYTLFWGDGAGFGVGAFLSDMGEHWRTLENIRRHLAAKIFMDQTLDRFWEKSFSGRDSTHFATEDTEKCIFLQEGNKGNEEIQMSD